MYVKVPCHVITGHNEVVAKVMFLHVSVILFTGGVSGQGEPPPDRENLPLGQADPPGTRQTPTPPDQADTPPQTRQIPRDKADTNTPQDQADTPLDQADTPRPGRHPPDQADPPGPGRHPPGPGRHPPPTPPPRGKQAPEYGLRAAGTHPTGMHSCQYERRLDGNTRILNRLEVYVRMFCEYIE